MILQTQCVCVCVCAIACGALETNVLRFAMRNLHQSTTQISHNSFCLFIPCSEILWQHFHIHCMQRIRNALAHTFCRTQHIRSISIVKALPNYNTNRALPKLRKISFYITPRVSTDKNMKICCKPCCYHFSLIALDLTTLKRKDKQFGTNFAPIRRNRIQCHQKNEQLKLLWTNEFHGNLVYWYIDVCEKKEHSKFPFDIDNEHCFFSSKHTHTHTQLNIQISEPRMTLVMSNTSAFDSCE